MHVTKQRFFALACLFESLFLLISTLISLVSDSPWWHGCAFNGKSILWAFVGSLFLFGLFFCSLHLNWQSLQQIRDFLDNVAGPYFRSLSPWQWIVISLIAGVAEEAMFRGTIQRYIATEWGALPGIFVASLLFGLAHWVTFTYAILAAIIGLFLGWLYWLSGNIGIPIMIHAIYDFGILTYYYGFKRSL